MKHALAIIFCLFAFVGDCFAAFTSDGTLITANNKSSSTSFTPSGGVAQALEVGHLGIITIAFDNLDTSDGNSTSVTSVTDVAGNTWTKAREFTNAEGGAGNGITVSVWYTVATTQLNSAGQITVNFSGSVTAKAIKGQEFSGLVGSVINIDPTPVDNAYDAADVGSATLSGGANVEHLWYRGIAGEETSTTWTQTSGWTKSNATSTTGSTADTNAVAGAEFRIGTGTAPASASDPTWYTADFATVIIGFIEPAPTPTPTATPAYAAFNGLGTFITASTKTTGSTYSPSTGSGTAVEVGHLAVIAIAADNTATSDGNTSLVTSVTDSAGNTWTKAREFTNANGSAGAGVTISVWYSQITSFLAGGASLSITFSGSIDAKAVKGYEFTKPSGTVIVDGTADLATDAGDPGAMSANGVTVGDFIFIRAIGVEDTSNVWSETNDFTKVNAAVTSGGAADSNVGAAMEFDIVSTNIGPSSDPTWYTADFASVYIGLTMGGQPTATPTPVPTNTATPTVTPTPGPPFSGAGTFITSQKKQAQAVWTPSTQAALNAGEVGIMVIATDNENDGSDGETDIIQTVTDSVGNTWTKAKEWTNGQGAPRAGVTNSVWYTKATTTLPELGTLTITFSEPIVSKVVKGYRYQWPTLGSVAIDGLEVANYDAQDPQAMSATGANGKTHLWVRANAAESPSTTWLATTGWNKVNASATKLDNTDTNISAGFEWLVQIGSSSPTTDPTWYSADHTSILVGFYSDEPEPTPTPTPTAGPTLTPTPTPTVDVSTRYECVKVTNTNDSGAGSFRECAERNGPTLCVFETSGRIDHLSQVIVKADHFIAGQTAPSPGIMMTRGTIVLGYSNTWLEHVEIRIGDAEGSPSYNQRDAVQISAFSRPPLRNVHVKNVSMSWAIDENLSTNDDVENVSVTDSIIAEGLRFSYHNEGTGNEEHSSGLIIGEKGRKQTFLRNLFIHNKDRNPLFKNNTEAEFINNFIFNHGPTQKSNTPRMEYLPLTYVAQKVDLIGNFMKPGVNSLPNMYGLYTDNNLPSTSKFYIRNNRGDTRPNEAYPEEAWVRSGTAANRSATPLLGITDPSVIVDVDQLLDRLEATAGSRPWERNALDARYFENARQGTGQIIDCVITERCTTGDVQVPEGGFPVRAVNTRAVPCDTDYNILEIRDFLEPYEQIVEPTPTITPTPTPTITPGGPTLTPTPTPPPSSGAKSLPLLGAG